MDVQVLLLKFLVAICLTIFLVFIVYWCRSRPSKEVISPISECWAWLRYSLFRFGIRYQRIKAESPESYNEMAGENKSFPKTFSKKDSVRKSKNEQKRLLSQSPNTPKLQYASNLEMNSVLAINDKDILPDLIGESEILTELGMQQIHTWLPNVCKYLTWRKLYASTVDGCSFRTFYRATQKCGAHLVLIQTVNDYRFGTFIPHDVRPNMKKVPSNEIFVFRIFPPKLASCYRWSGLNGNMLCAKSKSYLLGSQPSILLSDGFKTGSSKPSETFESPTLSKQITFDIQCIEIWQIKC